MLDSDNEVALGYMGEASVQPVAPRNTGTKIHIALILAYYSQFSAHTQFEAKGNIYLIYKFSFIFH